MSQKFLTHFQIEIPSPRKQKQNNFPWDAAYEFSMSFDKSIHNYVDYKYYALELRNYSKYLDISRVFHHQNMSSDLM